MKVGELISILQKFDENLSITIADGYVGNVYRGNWSIEEFEEDDGTKTIDIGIGGTLNGTLPVEEI